MVAIDVIARDRASATFRKVGASADTMATRVSKVGQKMGLMTGGLIAVGAAIKKTFDLGLDFTEQLNTLQAVTGATAKTMAQVSEKAKALGNDIEIPATSASDAAQAMVELAKGGLTVQQSMQAAKGTLQLAAAAQISGAQAAQIQANALNTFGLKASSAGHVADVLANTANAASGEITDFAQGFAAAGSVAKLFGISIDDTSTALGLLAKNGILGSDAGTSLKNMLIKLANPSKAAQAGIQKLGLTVYDSQGKFVGLRSLTDQLAKAQHGMSQAAFNSAAGVVFGTKAIKAASILAQEGVQKYDAFKKSVDKVGGAAELAGAKMKGLPGALQNMQNTLENLALNLYQAVAPTVEKIVKGISDAVSKIGPIITPIFKTVFGAVSVGVSALGKMFGWFSKLPGPIKAFGTALAGLAIANKIGLLSRLSGAFSGVGSALGGFRGAWGRIGDDAALAGVSRMRVGLGLVGSAAKTAGSKVMAAFGGPWGIAIAGATTAVSLLVQKFKDARTPIADVNTLIDENTGKLLANSKVNVAKGFKDYLGFLPTIGIKQGELTDAVLHGGKAYDDLIAKIKAYQHTQDLAAQANSGPIGGFLDLFGDESAGDHARRAAALLNAVTVERNALTDAQKKGAAVNKEVSASDKTAAGTIKAQTKAIADGIAATQAAADASDRLFNKHHESAAATTEVSAAQAKAKEAFYDTADAAQSLYLKYVQGDAAAAKASKEAGTLAGKLRTMAQAQEEAAKKAHDLTGRASELELELARLSGRTPTVEEATRAFNGALSQMKDDAKDAKGHLQMLGKGILTANGTIKTTTKSGQQLYDNITAIGKAAQDKALAIAELTGKTKGQKAAEDAAAASLRHSRQAFIDNAKQMGLTADQARKLANRYFGIPKNIKTVIKGDFTDVTRKLQSLSDTTHYIRLQGKLVGISTSTTFQGQVYGTGGATKSFSSANGFLASGGPAKAGRRYIVGEEGPEVLQMNPGGGGWVFNNKQFRQMMTGGLPGRASGGPVGYTPPSGRDLAGMQAFNPGPVMSVIKSALQTFWGALGATATAARDAAKNMRQAEKAYRQQVAEQGKTAREQTANLVKTRHEQIAAVNAAHKAIAASRAEGKSAVAEAQRSYNDANRRSLRSVNDAKTNLARVRAQAKQDRADAKADVDAAKPGRERQDALKRLRDVIQRNGRDIADASKDLNRAEQDRATTLRDAQRDLDKARKDADAGVATAEKNYRKAKLAAAKAVDAATKAQQRANVAERRKTAAAAKAAKTAEQAAAVEKRRAIAVQAMEKRTAGLRKQQAQLGRTLDSVNTKLATAKNNLASLKDARSQLSGSISGQITGDTSIMGLNATGVKGILAGLQSNLSQAKSFQSAIAKLTKGGLNNKTLQEIAGGGLAAGPLAKVLASATPQQIRQLNRLQSEIAKSAGRTGNTVADAQYAKSIKEQSQVVASFAGLKQEIKDALKEGSHELSQAFQAGIEGMTVQFKMGDETINAKIERIVKADMKKQAHAMSGSRP